MIAAEAHAISPLLKKAPAKCGRGGAAYWALPLKAMHLECIITKAMFMLRPAAFLMPRS